MRKRRRRKPKTLDAKYADGPQLLLFFEFR